MRFVNDEFFVDYKFVYYTLPVHKDYLRAHEDLVTNKLSLHCENGV